MASSYAILERARISMKKFRKILKYFSLDVEATKVSQLTGLNRDTVNKYLFLIHERIAKECEIESPISGGIEGEESFSEPAGGPSSADCLGEMKKYTKESLQIAPEPYCKR